MFPKKLYLGKWQHAKDGQMITTLGITHVLNISDSCENYLEESHRKYHYYTSSTFLLFSVISVHKINYSYPPTSLKSNKSCKFHLLANLTYLQLVVADEDNKPISNVFPEIFDFLKSNTETASTDEEIASVDPATMGYPNSTSTV